MSEQIETYYGLRLQVESMRKLYESARDGMRQLGSELESTRIRIAELETALAEARERWIQEREAWIAQKAECVTLQEKLAEAREDSARLTYMIDQSNQGNGWIQDYVWDDAARLCPLDAKEADDVQKWVRAAIDAAREAKP